MKDAIKLLLSLQERDLELDRLSADLAAVPVKKVKRDGKAIVSDTRPERTANLAKA